MPRLTRSELLGLTVVPVVGWTVLFLVGSELAMRGLFGR
jgi:hypothetical protein